MAIDLSQVTAITISEGSVTKIEVNGTTLWELPTNYRLLNYVTCDGDSYIDTGILSTNGTNAYCKFKTKIKNTSTYNPSPISSPSDSTEEVVFGNRASDYKIGLAHARFSTESYHQYLFLRENNFRTSYSINNYPNREYTIEISTCYNDFYMNVGSNQGTVYTNRDYVGAVSTQTMGLGAALKAHVKDGRGFIGNISGLIVTRHDNYAYKYKFIPVQRKSDSAIGFIKQTIENNVVTDTIFMPSIGGSNFVAGTIASENFHEDSEYTFS